MKRTDIMAHAMENLPGSPFYEPKTYRDYFAFYFTDTLSEYFYEKHLPIIIRDDNYFHCFKTFEDVIKKFPHTKIYPDDDLYQDDGIHFRLEEYREEKF